MAAGSGGTLTRRFQRKNISNDRHQTVSAIVVIVSELSRSVNQVYKLLGNNGYYRSQG